MKIFKIPRFLRLFFRNKTWDFSFRSSEVFITFDDGPHPTITPWVLKLLAKNDSKATFFLVGENAVRYPDLVDEILKQGHSIGNHSMRHCNGHKTPQHVYVKDVYEAAEVIPGNLFRPPYGRITRSQTKEIKKDFRIIMWSWLSFDYDTAIPVSKILTKARKQIIGGDILVLHENKKSEERLKEILPALLKIIEEKGLKASRIEMD